MGSTRDGDDPIEAAERDPRRADPDHRWDAGDAGCGSLIMGIGNHIAAMADGETLEVRVEGSGARPDLEAWCRMTGHRLLSATDGVFLLEKKVRD